jgi:hypothetical protein
MSTVAPPAPFDPRTNGRLLVMAANAGTPTVRYRRSGRFSLAEASSHQQRMCCIGMILSTHAVVGVALASFVPSHPFAAFVIGFASHFALDAIPHWDYPIKSRSANLRTEPQQPDSGTGLVASAAALTG